MNQVKTVSSSLKTKRRVPSKSPSRPFVKKSGGHSYEEEDELEVFPGGKFYQKAVQARDKYRELAREALVSGDRVTAESWFQHADHYSRIIGAAHERASERKTTPKNIAGDGNIASLDTNATEEATAAAPAPEFTE